MSERNYINDSRALSVSELNEYARKLMAGDPLLRNIEVTGEISGYKHHYSGHRYFSLKDESARVQCVMFRQEAMNLDIQPSDGMRVTVRASASIFPRDGVFQLYVNDIRQAGQGELYARFEALKRKLMAEGLFDPARKKEIPTMPARIGIVTSQTGAAIRDIIQIVRRRNPNVGMLISPCSVQGASAAEEIVQAIERLNLDGTCDVLLVGRGGGSIEDLWAFNEEIVARAISASAIPIISCVGHETDFTIADFVADLRAPTPSAAAELAVPELKKLKEELYIFLRRIAAALEHGQQLRHLRLERLSSAEVFKKPEVILTTRHRESLLQLGNKLIASFPASIEKKRYSLNTIEASLRALNPGSVLERGYAIVYQNAHISGNIANIDPNCSIRVCFSDGALDADITSIIQKEDVL